MRLRRLAALACLMLPFTSASRARGDEDPVVRGRRVSEWFKFLRDEQDPRRRLAALNVIDVEAGPKASVVFPGLVRELREHPDAGVRARIAQLMPKYKDKGQDVVVALRTALDADKEGRVREAAAVALGKLEDRMAFTAVPELGRALKDKYGPARAAAAETIGLFSRVDPEIARETIPALAEALKDPESRVRLQAAFALGRMGPTAAAAVPALAAALPAEKDAPVRKELAKTLAAVGPKAAGAAPALLAALRDPSADVRQAAAIALGKVGPDAQLALPELLKAAKDGDKSVRCHAVHAIGSLGKAAVSAIPELIQILKNDTAVDVRLAAIEELAGFGPDARAATDALSVASKDGRPAIREAAQEALKRIQQSP